MEGGSAAGCLTSWLSDRPYCRPMFGIFGHFPLLPLALSVGKLKVPLNWQLHSLFFPSHACLS